jgi:hypothetical protein
MTERYVSTASEALKYKALYEAEEAEKVEANEELE